MVTVMDLAGMEALPRLATRKPWLWQNAAAWWWAACEAWKSLKMRPL